MWRSLVSEHGDQLPANGAVQPQEMRAELVTAMEDARE